MTAFTYKGYGRIYTNPEHIQVIEDIIKLLDEFEWSYYPQGLVTSWDDYPRVVYVGKFELDEKKFKQICKERKIPAFVFNSGRDDIPFGYAQTLTKDEIQQLSYGELKMTTTITEEQLDQLWNAIEYTRGTIGHLPQQSTEKPDWVLIHKGRAHQSMAFLTQAKDLVNRLKGELK